MVERIDSIETTLAHIVPEFTSNLLAPIVILIYFFLTDWRLALWSLVPVIVGFLSYFGMMLDYKPSFERTVQTTKDLNDAAVEYIDGIEVIKAFGKTESSYAKFTKAAMAYADYGGHTLYASYGIAVWGTLCSQWNTCDFRFCHLHYFITWNRWTVDNSGFLYR